MICCWTLSSLEEFIQDACPIFTIIFNINPCLCANQIPHISPVLFTATYSIDNSLFSSLYPAVRQQQEKYTPERNENKVKNDNCLWRMS